MPPAVLARRVDDALSDDRNIFARMREQSAPEKPISPFDSGKGERFREARAFALWRDECRLDDTDSEAFKAGLAPTDPAPPDPFVAAPPWRADWDGAAPLSSARLIAEFGVATTEDDTVEGARGFRVGDVRDADRPRRPKVNRSRQYRDRASLREACRHDPAEFGRLVDDDVVGRFVLNRDELAVEALDIVVQPEDDPGLEVFRRGVIAWGKANEPFPFAAVYFDRRTERLSIEGYQPVRARIPVRSRPGIAVGEDAACAEHGLSPDELEIAITSGSHPIVRREGIVIALRKRESQTLPHGPTLEPAAGKSGRALRLVVDNGGRRVPQPEPEDTLRAA